MKQRILITGMGAVTPLGTGVGAFWQGVTSGRCGIREITALDASALPVRRAGTVIGFDAHEVLSAKLAMDLEPFMQYAYASAEEALAQSGLASGSDRTGVVMGTALAGMGLIESTGARYAAEGRQAGPKFAVKAMGNIAASQLAIHHGFRGPGMTVTTACSSGGDAIALAVMMLRAGMADAMVAMAGEAALCPALIQSLFRAGALSKTGESRPFDSGRNGFVMGEGGAALVLETEEHAAARGAVPLAELAGVGNNNDAYNTVSPDPSGAGAAGRMRLALRDAGMAPEEIGYINAHGTATRAGDAAEASAIRAVFGDHPVAVSSTKGATGHMMGAGGIAEVIACAQAVRLGELPVNTGFREADPDCPLDIVAGAAGHRAVGAALSNSMGFGGQNSCVIVRKV